MTPADLAAIEARAKAAVEYELTEEDSEECACPLCDANGYLNRAVYDPKKEASTVIAYGIGEDYKRAQEWVVRGPMDVLTLVAEIRRLNSRIEQLEDALDEADEEIQTR